MSLRTGKNSSTLTGFLLFMSRTAVIAMLLVTGLQCERFVPPAAVHSEQDQPKVEVEESIVSLPAESVELAGIKLEKAQLRKCRSVLHAMGEILAPRSRTAIVSDSLPGRVAEVHVKIGDLVKKNQPLVTLDSHEVGTAKSELFKALAARELAQVNLAREKRLMDNGIGIQKNLLAAEAEYKVAQATAEVAEKTLHVLGFTEQQVQEMASTHQISPSITLHAPIAGKIVANEAVLGAVVSEATELMTIIDPKLLWVDAEIYEKDIAKIKLGQQVRVTVPAYPGEVFQGKITYIEDVVNAETRTTTVRAEVGNEDYRLKPGMFADVNIDLNGECQMLVVPVAAILEEGERKAVFVKEEDHFVRREVQTGNLQDGYLQILSGLEAGQDVVVAGNHLLRSKLKEELLHQAHHDH